MAYAEPLVDRARGHWPGILSALNILDTKQASGKHAPCPLPGCGGKDRFRFDNKGGDGTWICSHCGAGKGVELVKRARGVEFKGAAELIEGVIGSTLETSWNKQSGNDARQSDEMIKLWQRSVPITAETQAGKYLAKRGCLIDVLQLALRCVPDERYFDAGTKATWHPCMVARIRPSDEEAERGAKAAIQRTYLDTFGGKADVPEPRKMLGKMPPGAAVRLMPHEDVLGIAEGIETALSASILHGVPVWAALNDGLLAAWTPPASVKVVMIFGDHDASYAGQAAAYALAKRLRAKDLSVFVELPPKLGEDWNDILLKQRKAA